MKIFRPTSTGGTHYLRRFSFILSFTVAAVICLNLRVSPASAASIAPTSHATPYSAIGCTFFGNVCISVCNNLQCTGGGLFVDHINVYTKNEQTFPQGGTACILVNGSISGLGGCYGIEPGTSGIYVVYETDFPNNAQVCGEIIGQSGMPCETILG